MKHNKTIKKWISIGIMSCAIFSITGCDQTDINASMQKIADQQEAEKEKPHEHMWSGQIIKTIPETTTHTPAEYKTIEHPNLYETIIEPEYKTITIPAEPNSIEVYDIKYVWVEPEYETIEHKAGTTDSYLDYKKPVYETTIIPAKQWTYKHAEIYEYKTELASKTDYTRTEIFKCHCGKTFTSDSDYVKHSKDAENAYNEAVENETRNEYWNGPYGNCSGGSNTLKYIQAPTTTYKATKTITKNAWTETVSHQSPSYTKYGNLISGGLQNSNYIEQYNTENWTENRVIKDGYWKETKYNQSTITIQANQAYTIQEPTGKTKTTTKSELIENAWTETIVTKESKLETTPAQSITIGTICADCFAIKCKLCDNIFENRTAFDNHKCLN